MSTPDYPVRLVGGHDLARSRLTVFFRLILIIPHAVVVYLYAILAGFAAIAAWFAALFTGRVPDGLHGFIAGYVRYACRVIAYGAILANPYPPFGGGGSYDVDLEIDGAVRQSRLAVFFRIILAIPCLILLYPLQLVIYLVAIGNWFVAIFAGRVPGGLESLGLFCMRFYTRTYGYLYLVNPRYPAFGDTPGSASLPANTSALPPLP